MRGMLGFCNYNWVYILVFEIGLGPKARKPISLVFKRPDKSLKPISAPERRMRS
ncbi:hypothetical protein Hanom_Chr00s063060g01785941 [Helianthus anomalus]